MTPLPLLTRAQGVRVKHLLQDKHIRSKERTFVVEGAKAVYDLLALHPNQILCLVATPEYVKREDESSRRLRQRLAIPQYSCSDIAFSKLSDLESPQGILALVRQPSWDENEILKRPILLGIYGEQLQDPANVGAIIRTAAALDAGALWLTPDSADVYSPKVVRSTSGLLLSVPIFVTKDVSELIKAKCQIYAAEVSGRDAAPILHIRQRPRKLVLAVGNEGRGLSASTSKVASKRFTIPLARQVESLNVAATVAIATFYFGQLPHVE